MYVVITGNNVSQLSQYQYMSMFVEIIINQNKSVSFLTWPCFLKIFSPRPNILNPIDTTQILNPINWLIYMSHSMLYSWEHNLIDKSCKYYHLSDIDRFVTITNYFLTTYHSKWYRHLDWPFLEIDCNLLSIRDFFFVWM